MSATKSLVMVSPHTLPSQLAKTTVGRLQSHQQQLCHYRQHNQQASSDKEDARLVGLPLYQEHRESR